MPTYRFRCSDHEYDNDFPIGEAPRSVYCAICMEDALLVIGAGVQIAPSALENKGGQVREADAREDRWNRDIPAYQRMRRKGMQPPQVDGAALLEDRCHDQIDVDFGSMYAEGVTRERVLESKEQADDIMANGIPR